MASIRQIFTYFVCSAVIILSSCQGEDTVVVSASGDRIDTEYQPIVYILPTQSISTFWNDTYGDRISFYSEEDLSTFQSEIDDDFATIKTVYNTVILFIARRMRNS